MPDRALPRLLLLFVLFVASEPFLLLPAAARVRPPTQARINGQAYLSVDTLAQRFGLESQRLAPAERVRLRSRWTTIDFTLHSLELELNGLKLFLSEPVARHAGGLYVSSRDAEALLAPILAPKKHVAAGRPRTLVIDAGHGGNDPGNRNPRLGLVEKTLTLDVARRLERRLRAQGFRVFLTRTTDRRVELETRTRLIARTGADLFVSIHFNGFPDGRVRGAETFVMTPHYHRSTPQRERDQALISTRHPGNAHDDANVLLGYHVHRQLVTQLDVPDRGLKRFRYHVLRHATCPAVLVEAGFLSNPTDGQAIGSPAHRERIAEAIADGIQAYSASVGG